MQRSAETRSSILDQMLRILAAAGLVAYLPSLYASVAARLWALAAVDSLALLGMIAASRSRRLGYAAKLRILIGISLAVAAAVLYATGPFGAGYVWLLCAVFSASLLGSTRLAAATAAIAVGILAAYGLLILLGLAPHGQDILSLVATSANLLLVGLLVASTSRRLVEGLERALEAELRLSGRLGEELKAARAADEALRAEIGAKEALLKELNHRVRNNIQVMSVILRLEEGREAGAVERMGLRVRALSLANEAFLSAPGAEEVELRAFVAGAIESLRPSRRKGEQIVLEPFSYPIPSEAAIGLSIAVAEIIAALSAGGGGVSVGLEKDGGEALLAFEWEGPGELGARIAADSVVLGLSPWGLAASAEGPGGRPRLVLGLPS